MLLAFVAGWLELCDVSAGQWGVSGNGVCCSRALKPRSSPLPLLEKQELERWYHTRTELPRVPRWQHGAGTTKRSWTVIWSGAHVKPPPLLGHVAVATHHRRANPVVSWWGLGFAPVSPLGLPLEVLVIRLGQHRQCLWLHFWTARKSFLAGTKEKTLKVIFCRNMVIVNWRFSSLLRNQIVIPKLCLMYPKHSIAFTKRRPLVIISLKK